MPTLPIPPTPRACGTRFLPSRPRSGAIRIPTTTVGDTGADYLAVHAGHGTAAGDRATEALGMGFQLGVLACAALIAPTGFAAWLGMSRVLA